ncbi:MAG: AzlC family ABC transporter permease [Deltaproteobacteria bacterium]|nr:AzlC family ABC transporter permease [Candidatus Anaeroferrophillacea bacterium]
MNDFRKGVKDMLPIITGVVPFGLIYGVTAANAGISPPAALGMSSILFAGAAQVALAELITDGTPVWVAVATVVLINLRMAMYSASIGPHIRHRNLLLRMLAAYLITDQAYAVSIVEFSRETEVNPFRYYLGAAVTLWIAWQTFSAVGIFVGATLPKNLSLEFIIPLMFLALAVPFLRQKAFIVTAVVTAAVMVVARGIPGNGGFFLAVFAGVFCGIAVKRRFLLGD